MENIKEFETKLHEVIKIKNTIDKAVKEFVAEYKDWSDIGETYGRILYFLSNKCREEALNKVNETLFHNEVEFYVYHNPYLANYTLHKIHLLHPEARKKGIEYIGEFANQEVIVDFIDLMGRQGDKISLPEEVEDFLSRFKQDIYWESSMSWYFNHQESNYYQDAVENLQLRISSVDLTTLKFVLDNLQSITKHRLEICCLDYDRLFKEKLCKN